MDKTKDSKFYIVKNVLLNKEIFELYRKLTQTAMWSLDRSSLVGNTSYKIFPGVQFIENGETRDGRYPYFIGYFTALARRIQIKFYETYGWEIPSEILRIALNAQNDNSQTLGHSDDKDPTFYSVVGFLTPVWGKDWGGELNIEGVDIPNEPGTFVVFPSTRFHKCQSDNIKKTPYWRISISYKFSERIYDNTE